MHVGIEFNGDDYIDTGLGCDELGITNSDDYTTAAEGLFHLALDQARACLALHGSLPEPARSVEFQDRPGAGHPAHGGDAWG